jgi:hypothetical protein
LVFGKNLIDLKKTMRPSLLFLLLAALFVTAQLPSLAVVTPAIGIVEKPVDAGHKDIASMKLKEFQRLAGRKLSFKEKIAFLVLKHQLKHHATDEDKDGQLPFILGLSSVGLLIIGLFVPVLLLGALVAGIAAVVTGSMAKKKDGDNRKANAGKLMGWITLGALALLAILAIVLVASITLL